ncbi:Uncharacterised protein [Yersinia mollaretii]|nr:Uncharacterised protein [Yersinia mollaretii]
MYVTILSVIHDVLPAPAGFFYLQKVPRNSAQVCTIFLMLFHPFQPRIGAACRHLHKCTKRDPFCVQAWRGDNRALMGLGVVGHLWLVRRLWVMVMCIRVMGVVIGYVRRAPRYGALRAL